MQDETQTPGTGAQEPNNAPGPGAANPGGGGGFGRDPSGEEPAAAPTDPGGSAFEWGATLGAGEVSFDPNGMAEEIADGMRAAGDVWQDTAEGLVQDVGGAFEGVGEAVGGVFDDIASNPFSPTEPDPEVDPASGDYGDPGQFNTGDAGPWGTQPPGTAQQEGEPAFNPFFTMPWEDLGVPSPATAEDEEEPLIDPILAAPPWEDVGAQPPGMVEQGEDIFTAPWGDSDTQPPGTAEDEEEPLIDPILAAPPWEDVGAQPPGTAQQEEDIFTPWDDSDALYSETEEEKEEEEEDEDVFSALLQTFMDPEPSETVEQEADLSGMTEEIKATADMWQDTAEGLVEDVSGAFEDVSETIGDTFDDIF